MKFFVSILVVLTSANAFAGYACTSKDGKTEIYIAGKSTIGEVAYMESKEVTEHYQTNHGLEIKGLDTVIDPETGRAVSSVKTNAAQETVYNFLMASQVKSTDTVWGLEFNATTKEASFVDQTGLRFSWKDLNCETGEL